MSGVISTLPSGTDLIGQTERRHDRTVGIVDQAAGELVGDARRSALPLTFCVTSGASATVDAANAAAVVVQTTSGRSMTASEAAQHRRYCAFVLTAVASTWSAVVTALEFASNARCAVIRLTISVTTETLLCSR